MPSSASSSASSLHLASCWTVLVASVMIGATPALLGLSASWGEPWVVQDDARQFIFWMERWADSTRFAGDPIATYFEAVSPPGYQLLHRLAFAAGISPAELNQLIPLVLGVVFAWFSARFALLLGFGAIPVVLGVWMAVFFAWLMPGIASGVPRAFALPLLMALLFYVTTRFRIRALVTCAALSVLYPQAGIAAGGIVALGLLDLSQFPRLRIRRGVPPWAWTAASGVVLLGGLLLFAQQVAPFGPTISVADAKVSPSFQPGGRTPFFLEPWLNWAFCGLRSGFFPPEWGCVAAYMEGFAFAGAIVIGTLLLAVSALIAVWRHARMRERVPGAAAMILGACVIAVVFCLIAWAALFELHVPSRYSRHILRATVPLCIGLCLGVALQALLTRFMDIVDGTLTRFLAGSVSVAALVWALIVIPVVPNYEHITAKPTDLHTLLRGRPDLSPVVSLSREADNIPYFAGRPTSVPYEYAIPYSRGHIDPFRVRATAIIEAQYLDNASDFSAFLGEHRVGSWLLDSNWASGDYVRSAWWHHEYPTAANAAKMALANGRQSALATFIERCTIHKEHGLILLEGRCLTGVGRQ